MDLSVPAPHSESPCRTSSAATSPKYDRITLEPHTSTPPNAPNQERSPTPSSLSRHKSPAEPAREGKRELYPCPFPSCHRVLKSPYTQQIHLKAHEVKPQKHFPCTMGCSESFTRHHDRLRHEVAQHGKQCEFSCKRCERFFSSQRMLDRHTCWGWRDGSLRWQLKGMFQALFYECFIRGRSSRIVACRLCRLVIFRHLRPVKRNESVLSDAWNPANIRWVPAMTVVLILYLFTSLARHDSTLRHSHKGTNSMKCSVAVEAGSRTQSFAAEV